MIFSVFFWCIVTVTVLPGCGSVSSSNEQAIRTLVAPSGQSDFRLPTTLKPTNYNVTLQPFLYGNHTFNGFVKITFVVSKPTSVVILHLKDIETKNESAQVHQVGGEQGQPISITNQTYDLQKEFYTAHLDKNLKNGGNYTISMHYTGVLSTNLRGFYYSTYKRNGTVREFASTQFQATHARKAFPCFDEPAFRATFDINIIRPETLNSLSTWEKIKTTPVQEQPGYFMDTFATTASMATYLNAFLVSDFVSRETPTGNTSFRVWAREEAINQTEYALSTGKKMLIAFENYFQIPYPFKKLDNIALPDFGPGGMENWGLILYRDTLLLYDPILTSAETKYGITTILAHELAHMWFGNLVTPKWWSDLWLSEGFATYMVNIAVEAAEPTFKIEELFTEEKTLSALKSDSLTSSHPIFIKVNHPDAISDIFDAITYSKGSSLLRMLAALILTESNFITGVTSYLKAFSYSNARQEDLWHHLTQSSKDVLPPNVSVKDIMDSWTLKMGYPVITVTTFENGTALLTQQRFLSKTPSNYTEDIDYSWWVPITYTIQSNPIFEKSKPKVWLKPTEKKKMITAMLPKDQWILFNVLLMGYYRVNYEESNWKMLTDQLSVNHELINTINRMQLISDSFNLAKAGLIAYSIPLKLIKYIHKEIAFTPLTVAYKELHSIASQLDGLTEYEVMKNFVRALFLPAYKAIGFTDSLSDEHQQQRARAQLVGATCRYGHQPCLSNSLKLYKKWMNNPANISIISPNVKRSIVCYGIQQGGEMEWNFALNRYVESTITTDNSLLLSALGCSKDITLKKRLLSMAFNKTGVIRKQNILSAIAAVCRDREGAQLTWDYLNKNYENIKTHFSTIKRVAWIMKRSSRFFNSDSQLSTLETLRSTHPELNGPGTRDIDNAIEEIKGRISFLNQDYLDIKQWLALNT